MTQEERIIRHIIDFGSVTRVSALENCSCANLTAVISTLKKKGHPIKMHKAKKVNKFGEEVEYAVYTMSKVRETR